MFHRRLAVERGEWVVYSKQPFGGPRQVLKYLARYVHRVAISNQRLVSIDGGSVTFRWRDYADGYREKTMTLEAVEFIRRFLIHVLPSGFVRIRHYGFLSNRNINRMLPVCRKLIGADQLEPDPLRSKEGETNGINEAEKSPICPSCKQGHMIIVGQLEPDPEWVSVHKAIVTSEVLT
jgi:hypothetical protein